MARAYPEIPSHDVIGRGQDGLTPGGMGKGSLKLEVLKDQGSRT